MKPGRRIFLFEIALLAEWLLKPRLSSPFVSPLVSRSTSPAVNGNRAVALKNINFFLREKVNYDIHFLWFTRAATGRLLFSREGEGFKAVLEAETKGFIGLVTLYRKHTYISHMSYFPERKKMRVDFFERYVKVGRSEEKTLTWTDYNKMILRRKDYKRGKLVEDAKEPIPLGVEYEDILSAFYNVRLGFYGPIRRGRQFIIKSLPSEGVSTIEVNFTTREDSMKSKHLFGDNFDENMLSAKVKVSKDLFKSKTGEVHLLFDDAVIPVYGVVKDYIGFGDIMAVLKRDE